MQKLVPVIYFYVVSLIGLVLLIIGIFGMIHFIVGVTAYDKYPLGYTPESRCVVPAAPVPSGTSDKTTAQVQIQSQKDCLSDVEKERQDRKAQDLEKGLSFTTIGLILFLIHFTYARRRFN